VVGVVQRTPAQHPGCVQVVVPQGPHEDGIFMVCIEWLESLALDHLRRGGGSPQLPEEKLRKFPCSIAAERSSVRICSLSPSRRRCSRGLRCHPRLLQDHVPAQPFTSGVDESVVAQRLPNLRQKTSRRARGRIRPSHGRRATSWAISRIRGVLCANRDPVSRA